MLTNTRIAVTGATGFIGTHLLARLVAEGAEITCLVRASSSTEHLPPGVHTRCVDLLTGEGLTEALSGQTVLIHLAALLFGFSWQNYLHANTRAAQCLCAALTRLGTDAPQTCILISSMAATGPSTANEPVTDTTLPHPVSAYGWSKLLVERTFQSSYQGRLVRLRPSIVYGSGDRGLLPMFRGAQHGFCVSPGLARDFPVSCIHGKDMAKAIVAALSCPSSGVYHVSDGSFYTMEGFCRAMGQALGTKPHIFHIPLPILGATAALSTAAGWLLAKAFPRQTRRAPNWNMDKAREARQAGWLCDATRLTTELGFTADYSLEQGMRESVAGYRERGWL